MTTYTFPIALLMPSPIYNRDTNRLMYSLSPNPVLPLSPEHTYIVIFSKEQYTNGIAALKTLPKIKILYESIPASNRVHPGISANTLVIFEIEE